MNAAGSPSPPSPLAPCPCRTRLNGYQQLVGMPQCHNVNWPGWWMDGWMGLVSYPPSFLLESTCRSRPCSSAQPKRPEGDMEKLAFITPTHPLPRIPSFFLFSSSQTPKKKKHLRHSRHCLPELYTSQTKARHTYTPTHAQSLLSSLPIKQNAKSGQP